MKEKLSKEEFARWKGNRYYKEHKKEIREAYDVRDKQLPPAPRIVTVALAELLESSEDPLETLRMMSQNYDCLLYISIPSTEENLIFRRR